MVGDKSEWVTKGGSLSEKNVFKEFGLTRNQIIDGINSGKLQYQKNYIYGNPFLKLLRSEVEEYAIEILGKNHFSEKLKTNELKAINREISQLKSKIKKLEKRKTELTPKINT